MYSHVGAGAGTCDSVDMNARTINVGRLFARPRESAYAILRRILSVNPGVSYLDIDGALRAALPNRHSPFDRLFGLADHERHTSLANDNKLYRTSYKRQCPICASELYHTDIYALEWLTRCPIHNVELTSTCPVCGQSWPRLTDIDKRDCPSCGRVSFRYLRETVLPAVRSLSYQALDNLYTLITSGGDDGLIIRDPDGMFLDWPNWLEVAQPTSKYYAALRAENYPAMLRQEVLSSGVVAHDVGTKTASLRSIRGKGHVTPEQRYRTPELKYAPAARRKALRRQLTSDFEVMRVLVSWVSKKSIPPHHVHIGSYRHLTNDYFREGPTPCVLCLALSVWFFHVMARHYAEYVAADINTYPFLTDNAFRRPLSGYEPEVIVGDRRYRPDDSFMEWFYQRGLLLTFVDIMDHACATRITSEARMGDTWRLEVQSILERSYPERMYLATVSRGGLAYHYMSDDVLGRYELPWRFIGGHACHAYQQFHLKHKLDIPGSTIGSFAGEEFTREVFDGLVRRFDSYAEALYGSLPELALGSR